MQIIKVISECKNIKQSQPLRHGFKRVEAIVKFGKDKPITMHTDLRSDYVEKTLSLT